MQDLEYLLIWPFKVQLYILMTGICSEKCGLRLFQVISSLWEYDCVTYTDWGGYITRSYHLMGPALYLKPMNDWNIVQCLTVTLQNTLKSGFHLPKKKRFLITTFSQGSCKVLSRCNMTGCSPPPRRWQCRVSVVCTPQAASRSPGWRRCCRLSPRSSHTD
jgi:hypothetical protein